jgi:phospholipase C
MPLTDHAKLFARCTRTSAATMAMFQMCFGSVLQAQETEMRGRHKTRSPIEHVIIIVGENRTFDHLFATYKPKHGQRIDNLLSKEIIREDGTPGPNYSLAAQYSAVTSSSEGYRNSPGEKTLFSTLPPPLTGGPKSACATNGVCTMTDAETSENGLPADYYQYLLTGGTGQAGKVPDARIANVQDLPAGPFQLTSSTFPYDSYAASPVHRFYQMWQQVDCNIGYATVWNPSGCKADLFPWVEVTVGAGTNGKSQASPFTDMSTGEGSTAMGFYNMHEGDVPYFKHLADRYAMSDNYHQPVMGGTGANSIMLGFADVIWFSDKNGNPATPPHHETVLTNNPDETGTVDEIEDPRPAAGTNNWYLEDGYGSGGFGFGGPNHAVSGGGSYTNCSELSAPGVAAIRSYLSSLPYSPNPNCDAGHYYLLNNYNPGYFGDGSNAYTNHAEQNTVFTIPPTKQRSIADVLLERNISWKYYGDQWNQYLTDKYELNYGTVGAKSDQYCNICNPFQYQTSIMANDAIRRDHLKDTIDLYADIKKGNLPAVSYAKPSGWVDGHPASSKFNLFEGFVKKIVDEVQSNKELWESTAIFVTVDERGGYYDSGYIQPLDYFGDGTRIPMLVVSPYTKPGHISHTYTDHASVIKFIERNWDLKTISERSRDNLPNPETASWDPYVPMNSPAIGDLFDLFEFHHRD